MIKFKLGDRVRVTSAFTWAKGKTGSIGKPMSMVGGVGGPTSYYRDTPGVRGMIRSFWVVFDEPQNDADGDGPYDEADIPEEYLEKE